MKKIIRAVYIALILILGTATVAQSQQTVKLDPPQEIYDNVYLVEYGWLNDTLAISLVKVFEEPKQFSGADEPAIAIGFLFYVGCRSQALLMIKTNSQNEAGIWTSWFDLAENGLIRPALKTNEDSVGADMIDQVCTWGRLHRTDR